MEGDATSSYTYDLIDELDTQVVIPPPDVSLKHYHVNEAEAHGPAQSAPG